MRSIIFASGAERKSAGGNLAARGHLASSKLSQEARPGTLAPQASDGPLPRERSRAKVAENVREALVEQRESFVFETVFSDPVGRQGRVPPAASALGYTVVLCFIGLESPEPSDASRRASMQGGHDVPTDKLIARYPRTLENLRRAIRQLPHSSPSTTAISSGRSGGWSPSTTGRPVELHEPLPPWLP